MVYRLPPLNSLRLFEAAGRHLSFKTAAEELHLTPSAVSHGIRSLEDWLGVDLFTRHHRGLKLTAAGRAYLPSVRSALAQIATASETVPGRGPKRSLSISVAPSFGARWLIPNLPGFNQRHPEFEVWLDSAQRPVDFPRDNIDLAIRMGRGNWNGLQSDRLIQERLIPVCAPALAERVTDPSDLAEQRLIRVVNVTEDWPAWARLTGVEESLLDLDNGPRFDNIGMALEAAAEGLGLAIGRLPLVEADLRAGRLQAVLGPPRRAETAYWLLSAPESLERPEVAAFRDWIRQTLPPDRDAGES
jgi:DNA-binding transcriptional LysR family regulator